MLRATASLMLLASTLGCHTFTSAQQSLESEVGRAANAPLTILPRVGEGRYTHNCQCCTLRAESSSNKTTPEQ
jgi:hypothetical protein